MNRARGWFLPCLLTTLVAALVAMPSGARALAQDEVVAAPSFLIEPVDHEGSYFTLEIEAGESETLTVALGNAGTSDSPARTYAADVYSLINGGFGINPEDEATTGTTTWLDYEAESLDIPPGRKLEREFTVSVPEDARPGQHITGIVIQTAEPVAVGGSEMLRQNIVKAIAVFITVPGDLEPELAIGGASLKQGLGSNSLIVAVENPGNVLLKPEGTITMANAAGVTVLTAPVAMGSVYAEMATTIEIPIPTVLAPGLYLVQVALADPETKAKDRARDLEVMSVDPSLAASPEAAPIEIAAISADPVLDPGTGELQLVNVAVTLSNAGGPLTGARLTLRVERDGELVEELPLSSSLVIPSGEIEIAQRYVPLGRWVQGDYVFTATLEATDLTTGQVTLLDTAVATPVVTVP